MEDLSGKIIGSTLQAEEFIQPMSEIQNVIEQLDQTLTEADLNQLGKGIAGYVANGTFYTDSGIADAYVLTNIGSKQAIPGYTDGLFASFIAGNTNTLASTVDIVGLGVRDIKLSTGSDPVAGDITGRVDLVYDLANAWFELKNPKISADVIYNAQNSGANGDGVTDNSTALIAGNATGLTQGFPPGTYAVSVNVSVTVPVLPPKGAMFKPIDGALIKFNSAIQAGAYKIFDLSAVPTETIVATASQTLFNLANAYVIGSGNLFVFYNDMLMDVTTGYTETSTTSITTTFGIPAGVELKFVTGGIQFGENRNDFADVATGEGCPEWWGAEGLDGVGDDTFAVNQMFLSHVAFKFNQNYPVTQVTIGLTEQRGDFNNFYLLGIAAVATSSVFEIKCGNSTIHNIRAHQNFNLNYECAIHWYTNLLPGIIAGVFGFTPGNNRFFGMQADAALIGLNIGALPSQSAAAMPAQTSSTTDAPTAINAPLSESHVFGFRAENCLNPTRMRQVNGKVTFSGSVASPAFGSFSTSLDTRAIYIAGVDGGEIDWQGGAVENVVDATGEMVKLENGNLFIEGSTMETIATSHLDGSANLRISKCPNMGLNSNTAPFFLVKDDSDAEINFDNQRIGYPANRLANGDNPLVKTVSNLVTQSFAPSDKLVVNFSNCTLRDVPFNGTTSPVTGGRSNYSDCIIDSIPSSGSPRDKLHRINTDKNILDGIVDVAATTIAAYPQTTTPTASGGWTFTLSSGTQSWGSDASSLPTPELTPISKSIRLTSVGGGGQADANSLKHQVSPSSSYVFDCFAESDGGTNAIIFRAKFFKFDGTASSVTVSTDFISGQSNLIGTTARNIQGLFKTPSDCTQCEIHIFAQGGSELFITEPSIRG